MRGVTHGDSRKGSKSKENGSLLLHDVLWLFLNFINPLRLVLLALDILVLFQYRTTEYENNGTRKLQVGPTS